MRDFFLRLRVILFSLIGIILITGFLVFPKNVKELAEELENQEDSVRIILAMSAAMADALLLFIIYQELRPRPRNEEGLLVKSRGASAEVTLESVKSHLETQISRLEDIYSAFANVKAFRGRVDVEMSIDAKDKVNVRKKSTQVNREIIKIIEKQLGLKLADKPVIVFRLMSEPVQMAAAPIADFTTPPSYPIIPTDAPAEEKKKPRLGGLFSRDKSSATEPDEPTTPPVAVAPVPPVSAPPIVPETPPAPSGDDDDDEFTFLVSPDDK